jgi:hypothetical protein
MLFRWPATSLSFLLCSFIPGPSSQAKKHEPERFVTLSGDQISTILGASREPHTMMSLRRLGAPHEYVNEDLEKLAINEGPCIYVGSLVTPAPTSTSEVDLECFDLVDEKESKSIAYTADSAGKPISSGSSPLSGTIRKVMHSSTSPDGTGCQSMFRQSLSRRSPPNALKERRPHYRMSTRSVFAINKMELA